MLSCHESDVKDKSLHYEGETDFFVFVQDETHTLCETAKECISLFLSPTQTHTK